jgi:hypothetical protein
MNGGRGDITGKEDNIGKEEIEQEGKNKRWTK